MISSLRTTRVTWRQFWLVVAVSTAATVLIITSSHGRTSAEAAALAALHSGQTVPVSTPVSTPTAGGQNVAPGSTASTPGASAYGTNPAPTPATNSSSAPGGAPAAGSTYVPPVTSAPPPTTTTPTPPPAHKSKVKHVFVIALSTTSWDAAFGSHSTATYLNKTLKPQGTFLSGYQTLGETELPDYLAMISGQPPNRDTKADCATYSEFPTGTQPANNGTVPASGCVYPNTVTTLADQVTAKGGVWSAYIDQMNSPCVHPNSDALDNVALPGAGADYDTRHNPFIYFHSLLDLGGCAANDLSLNKLPQALSSMARTPTVTFIAPRGCLDTAATACSDGRPAGMAGEDRFLKRYVPEVLHSAAYRKDGALMIVFAQAAAGSTPGTLPKPDISAASGALVLSRFAKRGGTIPTSYYPYSILRTIEDLLGYDPLALAKKAKAFAGSALPGA